MARHGESKHFKRSVVTAAVVIPRKKYKYYIKELPGKHRKSESIAVGGLLRDIMKICSNIKESKYLISQGSVRIDGKKVTELKYNVGFGDLLDIKGHKYIVSFNEKGKVTVLDDQSEGNIKRLKVMSKGKAKGGKTVLRLNDGRNILSEGSIQTHDTLLLNVSTNKIEKVLPFEQGANVMVYRGKNAGSVGKITKVTGNSVELRNEGGSFIAASAACIVL